MFGSSSTPNTEKRNLSNTSIQDNSLSEQSNAKQAKFDTSPVSSLVGNDSSGGIISMLAELRTRFDTFENNLDKQFKSVLSKLDDVYVRIATIEESASSQQIEVDNLSGRVEDLEKDKTELVNSNTELENRVRELEAQASRASHDVPDWEPSGSCETKILLLGDSNSAGKLKFGEGKGTLGKALPGSSEFCAKFSDLLEPDSEAFSGVSDVVLAVGTNELKHDGAIPSVLAKDMSRYVKSISSKHPSTHLFIPGVLPTCSENANINSKIQEYNYFVRDLCTSNPRLTFIDNKVFSTILGGLKPNLGKGPSDPLHLSEEGIRLYCSRFKYAIRQRHSLPVGPRRRNVQAVSNSNGAPPGSARGGTRGGYRGRGGRAPPSRGGRG